MKFPMFIELEGRTCLVIGAGSVAQRKRAVLESFGAKVTVVSATDKMSVAPEIGEFLESTNRRIDESIANRKSQIANSLLVVAATNDPAVNRHVAEVCRARNIPVNVVDDPANCTFFFPAIFRKGPITAAVSSGGTCPVAAKLVRDRIAEIVPDGFVAAVEDLGRRREELKRQYPDPKERARVCREEVERRGEGEGLTSIRRFDDSTIRPFPRLRRLRTTAAIRDLVRENHVRVDELIYPVFVVEGTDLVKPVESMPGICQYSPDRLGEELDRVVRAGIKAILLFGIPAQKDDVGSGAYAADGVVPTAIRLVKAKYPDLVVIADVCLCEYTSHGHCGVVRDGRILNDETLPLLAKAAVAYARAGADIVAPSDMMDGRVGAIRAALDAEGFSEVAIMAYSAKFSSGYYGPFRDAAHSAPQFGDRRTYQMDPANGREALREVAADVREGADYIIAKPATAYLDIVRAIAENFDLPIVAYNVSGEYAMVKAAAANGWIDERRIVLENLVGMKRAGAKMIITYHALDAAAWLCDR